MNNDISINERRKNWFMHAMGKQRDNNNGSRVTDTDIN